LPGALETFYIGIEKPGKGGRVSEHQSFQRRAVSTARVVAAVVAALALSACGGGDGGGDTHALGEAVVVGHYEATDTGARGPSTQIELTVLAVRQGSQGDLTEGGFEVDPEDQSSTPYYIDARYVNKGEETVTRNLGVSLEDSDGNLIGSTLIFDYGDQGFEPCERVNEGKFEPGDSYESCTLFLVPEGTEIGKVSFLSDNGEGVEPEFVYWESE
jgi:hypothetical protein